MLDPQTRQKDAAGELRKLQEQKERLPGLIEDAVKAGDYETARNHRAVLSECEDRISFCTLQVAQAEQAVLDGELAEAKADVALATRALQEAFLSETKARVAWDDAKAHVARAQGVLGTAQSHVASLEQQRRDLERRTATVNGKNG